MNNLVNTGFILERLVKGVTIPYHFQEGTIEFVSNIMPLLESTSSCWTVRHTPTPLSQISPLPRRHPTHVYYNSTTCKDLVHLAVRRLFITRQHESLDLLRVPFCWIGYDVSYQKVEYHEIDTSRPTKPILTHGEWRPIQTIQSSGDESIITINTAAASH
jgi:hypothetical protein